MGKRGGFILTSLLALVLAGVIGAVLVMARFAQPGSVLYPLLVLEDKLAVMLALNGQTKTNLRLKIMNEYLQGLQNSTLNQDREKVVDEIKGLSEQISNLKRDLDKATGAGQNIGQLQQTAQTKISEQIQMLGETAASTSGQARQEIEQQIEALKDILKKLQG